MITATVSPNFSVGRGSFIVLSNDVTSNHQNIYQVANNNAPDQIGDPIYVEKSGSVKTKNYSSTSKQVHYNADWINHEGIDASTGSEHIKNLTVGGTYSLTVSANNTGKARFSIITVSGIDGTYNKFEVIQSETDDKYINADATTNIPAAGGIYQITVTSNVSWKIYGYNHKLISNTLPLNGEAGTTVINITVPANNLYENVYPQLIIYDADNNIWKELKFTQTAANASFSIKEPNVILTSASGYYLRVSPITNLPASDWNLSANNTLPGWISLYGKFNNMLYFEITQPNTTSGILTTSVIITFTGGSAVLNISQTGQNFTPHYEINLPQNVSKDGGVYAITITSNISLTPALEYFLAPDLYLYYSIWNRNFITGNTFFNVTIPANNLAYEKKYQFGWGKPEDNSLTYGQITQQSGSDVSLEIYQAPVYLSAGIESSGRLFINSNTNASNPFMITQLPSWLSFSSITGSGYNTLYATTTETNSGEAREANVVVTISGAQSQSFKVVQKGANFVPSLSVDKTSFVYEAEGGTGSFTITSNNKWAINPLPNAKVWASFSSTIGEGTTLVNFTINGILDIADNITVYFIQDAFLNSQQIDFHILARGKKIDGQLDVPGNLSVAYTAGSYVVTIGSNISWSATGPNWVNISPQATNGTTAVTLTIGENPANTERTAIITVSGGGFTRLFNVTQAAGTITGINNVLVNDGESIYPNPNSGSFTLYAPGSGTAYVYNLIGYQVSTFTFSRGKNNIEIESPSGIYILKTGSKIFKLVIK